MNERREKSAKGEYSESIRIIRERDGCLFESTYKEIQTDTGS